MGHRLPRRAWRSGAVSSSRGFFRGGSLTSSRRIALGREREFARSGVLHHDAGVEAPAGEYRRSRVLYDLGTQRPLFVRRLLDTLPFVLPRLGCRPFPVSAIDTQMTATNDGEYFRPHIDHGHRLVAGRTVSFTYFFHREPRAFSGGELRLYDTWTAADRVTAGTGCTNITPRRNSIVFFPSGLLHEIAPVCCPSRAFRDSRFTINGWIYR